MQDVLKGLLQDIIRIFARLAVTGPLASGVTGLFQNTFGLGGASPTPRAMGGPVSANSPYLVGEAGPELFMPRAAGYIVPNNKLGGAAVTNVFNVDARSDRETLIAELDRVGQRFSDATLARVKQEARYGRLI